MKNIILSITAMAAIASSAPAATVVYNDSTGSYTGYQASSPFFATFGAITNQDPNPISETTSVYDYRGLTATVSTGATYFFLEDFEDGQLDSPGLSFSGAGTVRTTDGRNGSELKSSASGVAEEGTTVRGGFRFTSANVTTWTFDSTALGGNLPTYFGFAIPEDWNGASDYAKTVIAYDINDNVIGTIDNTGGVTPSAVPFYGFKTDVGIAYLQIASNSPGESDHFQYGYQAVPEPSALMMISLLGCFCLLRRKR